MNRVYRIKIQYDKELCQDIYWPQYSYLGLVWQTISRYRDGSGRDYYLYRQLALQVVEEDRSVQSVWKSAHKNRYEYFRDFDRE